MPNTRESLVEGLADLVQRPDDGIDLPTAALVVARVGYPSLDIGHYRAMMRDIVAEAVAKAGEATVEDPAGLVHVVFGELGFRANRDEYYDPRNSFLNDVLDRRLGIPISLSLVYIEIAEACGRPTEGVGFPGHFLVRDLETGQVLDPYNGGSEVDKRACLKLLTAAGLKPQQWKEEYLHGVGKRDMLLRMIANLQRIYTERGDTERMATFSAMTARLRKLRELGTSVPMQ